MRTSSVKTTVSAITLALTLAVLAPTADARAIRDARKGRGETFVRAVVDLLKRLGGVTTNAGPSIPLGDPKAADDTTLPSAPTNTQD